MKSKCKILICCLLLSLSICGCGKSSSVEHIDFSTIESETVELENETENKYLYAYQEILKAAPAIEGEHDELSDASFGAEENREMFGNHDDMFALFDLNQDNIPELITLSIINFRWTKLSVFSYIDDQTISLNDVIDQCSTANGAYITYICEENHIHSVWRGTDPFGNAAEENTAYAFDGMNLTMVQCDIQESDKTIDFYDIANTNTVENVDEILR